MVAFAVLFTYAIQFFVPVQLMFPKVAESWKFARERPVLAEYLFRSFLVLLTYAVVMLVKNLGALLSLVGSVFMVSLIFVFPVICQLILTHNEERGISWWMWIKNSAILVLAMIGFLLGGFLNLKEIINDY